jgi:hypothetical protein
MDLREGNVPSTAPPKAAKACSKYFVFTCKIWGID